MSHYPCNFEIVLDLYLISISWCIYKTYWLQATSTTQVCFSGTQSLRQTFLLIKVVPFLPQTFILCVWLNLGLNR